MTVIETLRHTNPLDSLKNVWQTTLPTRKTIFERVQAFTSPLEVEIDPIYEEPVTEIPQLVKLLTRDGTIPPYQPAFIPKEKKAWLQDTWKAVGSTIVNGVCTAQEMVEHLVAAQLIPDTDPKLIRAVTRSFAAKERSATIKSFMENADSAQPNTWEALYMHITTLSTPEGRRRPSKYLLASRILKVKKDLNQQMAPQIPDIYMREGTVDKLPEQLLESTNWHAIARFAFGLDKSLPDLPQDEQQTAPESNNQSQSPHKNPRRPKQIYEKLRKKKQELSPEQIKAGALLLALPTISLLSYEFINLYHLAQSAAITHGGTGSYGSTMGYVFDLAMKSFTQYFHGM